MGRKLSGYGLIAAATAALVALTVLGAAPAPAGQLPRIHLEQRGGLAPQEDLSYQPGRFVSAVHSSIQEGDTVTLVFDGGTYYQIEVETSDTYDGYAVVGLPFYYNSYTGGVCGGYVYMSLKGHTGSARVYLEDPSQTGLSGPSPVLRQIWMYAAQDYLNARRNLEQCQSQTSGLDASESINLLNEKVSFLTDCISQVYYNHQLIVTDGSSSQTITSFELEEIDRVLLAQMKGWYELDQIRNGITAAGSGVREALWTEEELRARIESVVAEAKRASQGNKVVIGVVSLGVGTLGLVVGGPVGGVAAAGGVAVTYFSVTYDLGSAAVLEGITSSAADGDGQSVEFRKLTQQEIANLGLQGASVIEGPLAQLAGLASNANTLLSTVDNWISLNGGGGGNDSLPSGYECRGYVNFNEQAGLDCSKADLQIFGDPDTPSVSWRNIWYITRVEIQHKRGIINSYCIKRASSTGGYIRSPVTYYNYSVGNAIPCDAYRSPPTILVGSEHEYEVLVFERSGGMAMYTFSRVR